MSWEVNEPVLKQEGVDVEVILGTRIEKYDTNGNFLGLDCIKDSEAICFVNVKPSVKSEVLGDGEVSGKVVNMQEGVIGFAIDKGTMTQNTYNFHFADGVYHIVEDWEIQEELIEALDLPIGFTISAGEYPINTEYDDNGNEYLTVVLY